MAADQGLSFGGEVVFTYGPLGFLSNPQLYFGWESALGLLFVGLVSALMAWMLLRGALRRFSWPLAVLLSFGVLSIPAALNASLGDRPAIALAVTHLHEVATLAAGVGWR